MKKINWEIYYDEKEFSDIVEKWIMEQAEILRKNLKELIFNDMQDFSMFLHSKISLDNNSSIFVIIFLYKLLHISI